MIVACSQYQSREISSIEEFENHVKDHLEQAHKKGAELILFPEFLAVELLTLDHTPRPEKADMEAMFHDYAVKYTDYLASMFKEAAEKYQMAIAAGSHFVYNADEDRYRNTAFVYLPDGTVFKQNKIHRAIEMVYNRHMMTPGDEINAFDFNGIRVAVNICYDNSFPESARISQSLGADLILSPVCAFDEYGKTEQALFCRARASENFLFDINAQMVGQIGFPYHLPYGSTYSGRSGIYCPIHPSLSLDGILAQAKDGEDQVITANLDIARLRTLREKKMIGVLNDWRGEVYKKYLLK